MTLKEFRLSKGINQKQMAYTIKVSPSYYYKIESGVRKPSYDFLVKLKTTFPEISVDTMFFSKTKRQ